jgi:hypothetical protein
MRIEDLRYENNGSRTRAAATVIWEDCARPTQEVYFETEPEFAAGLSCNPHAFLVGHIVPAMEYGEKRVFIDAEICPELRDGLTTVMTWLRHWYYRPDRDIVRIEAKAAARPSSRSSSNRAGFFFSGGIDSLATLRTNRLNFPETHPGSIKDGLLVYGLELDSMEAFGYVKDRLADLARGLGITLVPVYTNLYLNYRAEDAKNSFLFWNDKYEGAALSAVAHAFSQRYSVVSTNSAYPVPVCLKPKGTNPLMEPYFSSYDLRIRYECTTLSRLERTRLVADWDVALQHLRVCNQFTRYTSSSLNCGRCEKCIRTKLTLLALGKLDRTTAFADNEVSEELIRTNVRLTSERGFVIVPFYEELITPLRQIGRLDLARVVERKVREHYRHEPGWEPGWKGRVKRFDRKYLGGRIALSGKRMLSEGKLSMLGPR